MSFMSFIEFHELCVHIDFNGGNKTSLQSIESCVTVHMARMKTAYNQSYACLMSFVALHIGL